MICKDKDDSDLHDARVQKMCLAGYKFVWYTGMSAWAFILIKDTLILPTFLGGKGSVANSFTQFPYAPQTPGLLTYSLVQLGYYLDDVINHNLFKPKTNDFWEMNLHHLLTIGLFGGMILMNCVNLGAMVSFLHGISDIHIAAARIGSHTIYLMAARVIFVSMTVFFIFFRNYVIPIYTIACWDRFVYPPELSKF